MALNPDEFDWALARLADAEEIRLVYTESVSSAGHSPVVKEPTIESLKWLVGMCQRCGYPMWTLRHQGALVGWCMVRAISWGHEVTARTGDFSVYVAEAWQGQGVPMMMIRKVHRELRRYGFDAVTCWIFSQNRKSLSVARAFRMQRWGHLPRVADIGGIAYDVEIWGTRLDDDKWTDYMDALDARHTRWQNYLQKKKMTPVRCDAAAGRDVDAGNANTADSPDVHADELDGALAPC